MIYKIKKFIKNIRWFIIIKIRRFKSAGLQRCPRRDEMLSFNRIQPGADPKKPDHWNIMPNGDLTCSYCGSLHPDDFYNKVVAARAPDSKINIEQSDKRYKIYVSEEGIRNAKEGGIKFYTPHIPGGTYENRINRHYNEAIKQSWRRHSLKMDKITNDMLGRARGFKNSSLEPDRF